MITTTNPSQIQPIEMYEQKIIQMLETYYTQDSNAVRYKVSYTDEASRLVLEFEHEIMQQHISSMPKTAEPCLRKLHGQAARFAWGIHAWNNDTPHASPVTAEEMTQGISICRYSLPHIKYAYDPCGLQAYEDAIKIVEKLFEVNMFTVFDGVSSDHLDSRTIQQRVRLNAERVDNALRLLERHNALRIIDSGTRKNIIVLHPNFYGFKWY